MSTRKKLVVKQSLAPRYYKGKLKNESKTFKIEEKSDLLDKLAYAWPDRCDGCTKKKIDAVHEIMIDLLHNLSIHLTPRQINAIVNEYVIAYTWARLGKFTARTLGKDYPLPLFSLKEKTNVKPDEYH